MKIIRFSFEKLFRIIRNKMFKEEEISEDKEQKIIDDFHKLFFQKGCDRFKWFGVDIIKYPTDLMVYQEIIFETKPDTIIECGTDRGGSALYFAHLFDMMGNGQVITIDIDNKNPPQHNRIKYLIGSSTSNEVINEIEKLIENKKVMVILDSDHDKENVLKELILYSNMVSRGCYLVVEDTNLNGHPVHKNFGAGPMEAVEKFLKENNEFEIDKNCERFLITASPNGYLRRKTK